MTSGMRVTPTNAERGERRQVYNISDAISVRCGRRWPHITSICSRIPPSTSSVVMSDAVDVGGAKFAAWRLRQLTRNDLCLLGFSTSAGVNCASICRVFDGRPWSLPKRAVSCPEAGQVASRRTMWAATQLVCCLISKPSSQDIAA